MSDAADPTRDPVPARPAGAGTPVRPVAAGRVFIGPCLPGHGGGFADRPMARRVLLDHPDILVIDKPHGLPVHYGARCVDHLELYLPALSLPDEGPPRLGHRLDKDTTGCLALGRHEQAASRLGRLFLQGRVDKGYWAVALGWPDADDGLIDLPLVKRQVPGCARVMVDADEGKPAQTRWRVLARGCLGDGRRVSWLDLTPLTGRMHQLRAHCEAMGWPLLGDPIYGRDWRVEGWRDPPPSEPLHLHARWISLPWGVPGEPVLGAVAPPPPHMLDTMRAMGIDDWAGREGMRREPVIARV